MNKKQKFELILGVFFSLLAFLITLFWTIETKKYIVHIINDKVFEDTKDISSAISKLIDPVEQNLKIIHDWGTVENLKEIENLTLNSFFKPILNNIPHANALFLADTSGWLDILSKDSANWDLTVSEQDALKRTGTRFLFDKTGKNVLTEAYSSNLNIFERPWYIGAIDSVKIGKIFWTKPYKFFQNNRLGITASISFRNSSNCRYIFAIDIFLKDLINAVNTLDIGDDGFAFLVSEDEQKVLKSNKEFFINKKLKYREREKIAAQIVSRINPITESVNNEVKIDNIKYKLKVKKLSSKISSIWFVVVIPENEIIIALKKRQRVSTVIFVILILLAISTFIIWIKNIYYDVDLIQHTHELNKLFNNSNDVNSFLRSAVEKIAKYINSPVCSIYFFDKEKNMLSLKATYGLNSDLINTTTLEYGEGIVGHTLKELRPMNISYASDFTGYKAVENLNEKLYDTFLTMPIVRGVNKIGVLVVQRKGNTIFNNKEFKAMGILASQLTSVLETAGLFLSFSEKDNRKLFIGEEPSVIKGVVASPGYAIGYAFNNHKNDLLSFFEDQTFREYNLKDFNSAVDSTTKELEKLQLQMENRLADSAGMIFTAHLLMLKDVSYKGAIEKLIKNGVNPPIAILHVAEDLMRTFAISSSRTMKEKVDDIKDVTIKLLSHISTRIGIEQNRTGRIVIANNILPSEILVMAVENVAGIILRGSGVTSHVAILCRSLSIPLLITDDVNVFNIKNSSNVLIVASDSRAYINPSVDLIENFNRHKKKKSSKDTTKKREIKTADGKPVKLYANINILSDLTNVNTVNSEGVGLYRSEFSFLIRDGFPSEEEQFNIYKKIFHSLGNRELTFRTLDIGGDKVLSYFEDINEENPFLGLRAIRFSLKEKNIFKEQLRAILRAGAMHNLRIMFPMIQSIDEFVEAKSCVTDSIKKLTEDGIACNNNPQIGMMIEIPSVVSQIDEFAKISDFFSIGTNDLIQYYLAVDRTNSEVSHLYQPNHPSILKAIKQIAEVSIKTNTDLSVCGDMAGCAKHIPFLLGCGINKLSVDPIFHSRTVDAIKTANYIKCQNFADNLLNTKTVKKINQLVIRGC